jgi:titin
VEWLEQRLAPAAFLVTTTGDNGNDTTPTPGSLRAAIVGVNASADPSNTINFNIPGSGVQTITPPIELPRITNPVTINGYSQPGSSPNTLDKGDNATILIELNGSLLPANNSVAGLTIGAASATISGLVIDRVSSGNGIAYTGSGSVDVNGNFLGVDPTASTSRGNNYGFELTGGSSATIGGTTPAARNVISGNAFGIVSFPSNTLVEGNYIGTDAAGEAALGGGTGIYIGGPGATIGGTATAARNVISGNTGYGIYLAGSNGMVEGNYIGTDASGEAALGDGNGGIYVPGAAATIGGTATGARNVISANGADGILLTGPSGLIEGNYIGVDATGEKARGNHVYGLLVEQRASSTTIGGTAAGAANVISANGNDGIILNIVPNVLIAGNFIGTDAAGDIALGNRDSGVEVRSTSPSVTIGGTTAGALNVISGNGGYGIVLDGPDGLVQGNYVGVNEGGGSALGNELGGVFVGSGASSATIGGTSTAAAGNVISGNGGNGVLISADDNLVVDNQIGTAAFAAGSGPIPNAGDGIQLAAGADFNTVGGTSIQAINTIASNGGDGIDIQSASNNSIEWNLIGRNS